MTCLLPLHRTSAAILLALVAPASFAQTPAAGAAKPAAAVAAPKTVPASTTAKPTVPATPVAAANPAGAAKPAPATAPAPPAAAGSAPADPTATPPAPPPPPLSDIIFTNGDIITLDDKHPAVQAIAIKGSKIIAVGTSKAILARWKSEGTEVVDLAGKTLVPGFIDAWGELSRLGLYSVAAQLQSPPAGRITDSTVLLRELRDWAKGDMAKRLGWVIGFGYDESRLRELRAPSRNELDNISSDRPVIIVDRTGTRLVANSRALTLAGIDRNSIDPPGGRIGRWPGSKEPDGSLEGAAATALLGALPQLGKDERQALIQQGQTLYLRNGYTTAVEARATADDLALYTQAADAGALKLDVSVYAEAGSAAAALKAHKQIGAKYYKGHLRLAGVSFTLDGTAEDRSAWLTQPYQLPPPGKPTRYAGYPLLGEDTVDTLFNSAYANGWQVAVQANGDAAIDQFIKGLKNATEKHPGKDRRPLLVGAATIRDDQLDALKTLGVSVSLAPQRLGLSLDTLTRDALGAERSARFSPAAAALGRGLPLTLHNDAALIEPAPLEVLAAAVKRPVGTDQQVPAVEALKAITLNAARQLGEEKIKGSIAVGKLADLTVLSTNPLKTPTDKLGDIRVIGTVKEGATVFGGADGGVPITR
ncbi:MAG: amidohydrolase [Proteobacteria bacterium]|nr:amidohydrolase [Pseudomonadota bacterium]